MPETNIKGLRVPTGRRQTGWLVPVAEDLTAIRAEG